MATKQKISSPPAAWTFLTNHAHVLICLSRDPALRVRDLAALVGITERAVQNILAELQEAGVVEIVKDGRRNTYKLQTQIPLRHPVEARKRVRDLIEALR